ncbi:MAG: FG-GAP repeat protein, partial [Acidobacteria bacterium]|nr:FG-GAP repeat protein [Acidobacteriota bacterium]
LGAVGDFNGDGKPDVMWRNRVSGANAVWYLDGVAVTGTAPFVAVGTTWELSD